MRKRRAGERKRERTRSSMHETERREGEERTEEVRQGVEVRAKEKAIETLKEPRGC